MNTALCKDIVIDLTKANIHIAVEVTIYECEEISLCIQQTKGTNAFFGFHMVT